MSLQSVKVGHLKANLSATLKLVRGGAEITVCDRDKPIAKIIPIDDAKLVIRPAKGAFKPIKSDLKVTFDPIAGLLADRARR